MTFVTRKYLLVMTAVCCNAIFVGESLSATIDCSGTKNSKWSDQPSAGIILPGDRSDHEMIQAVRHHRISSQNGDFDGSTQTAYAHQDAFGGTGTSIGYFLYTLKSGDKIWAKFDSVYSTKRVQSSWESSYQGVFRFVGGTGKYAAIHGGGHYQGKITPSEGFEESFSCTAEY